ncbi:MAG: transporter substrate-binding domain-containing protein [Desulfovibrio sp.]|nr:transporter substrate-binding domain-containing protein [Desulfovibrio sp.]MCA1985987.1 transporter substrate-binding domain-containing protein [Desulfovibrio sp.]
MAALWPTPGRGIELSQAERDYLDRLGPVTLCVDPDWEPFERINEQGQHEGIAADLLLLVSRRLGVPLQWLLFTDSNVFITREEHPFIADPAALAYETIVFPEGTSMEERIRREYPNLRVVTVASEQEAFALVSEKKVDMTIRSLIVAAYTIKKDGWFNLKIAGQLPNYSNELRMGVVKDEPMLRDILNKGVRTITPMERGHGAAHQRRGGGHAARG